ncbi:jg8913 [Pararge aegeria aegeria]|uniref:Jg8913 protein n=1 Tax=Pararge aegeria aegeria TaxID=348720 RepID=A0A8S4SHM7_9NEOP|nr:jg8913 [Pararge aegeria aegeria]
MPPCQSVYKIRLRGIAARSTTGRCYLSEAVCCFRGRLFLDWKGRSRRVNYSTLILDDVVIMAMDNVAISSAHSSENLWTLWSQGAEIVSPH